VLSTHISVAVRSLRRYREETYGAEKGYAHATSSAQTLGHGRKRARVLVCAERLVWDWESVGYLRIYAALQRLGSHSV
jgi:hypothetical protein